MDRSTATELAHLENGNAEFAAASRMTRDRSTALLVALLDRMSGLRPEVEALLSAVRLGHAAEPAPEDEKISEWVAFCKKWGYGAEQQCAIAQQLGSILY